MTPVLVAAAKNIKNVVEDTNKEELIIMVQLDEIKRDLSILHKAIQELGVSL